MNDKTYLKRCSELAEIAQSEGESPVGCVIVKSGNIIGEGSEKSRQLNDITRHAEIVAILDALKRTDSLKGATLYTNMEPCILCSYAIRHHNFKRVVFSKPAGELGGTAAPFNLLTTPAIQKWGKPPEVTILDDAHL